MKENIVEKYIDKSAKYKEKYKDFDFEKEFGKVKRSKDSKKRGGAFGGDTGKDADYRRTKRAPGETK